MKRLPLAPLVAVVLGLAACAPPAPRFVAPLRYGAVATTPDAPFRDAPPPPGPSASLAAPKPRVSQLPNGMRVLLLERHGFPAVAVRLIVNRGGSEFDPGGSRVAEMSYLYERGGDETAFESASEELARTGASSSESATDDALVWAADAPPSALEAAFARLAKRSYLAQLSTEEYARRSAEWVHFETVRGRTVFGTEKYVLFGKETLYGLPRTEKEPLTIDQAALLRRRILQPAYATLVVVGDVAPEVLDALALGAFGAWPSTEATMHPWLTPPPWEEGARVSVVVDRRREQRQAAIFARGPLPASPDLEPFLVTAAILGSWGGRLTAEVRGEMGATYSLAAPVHARRLASWLSVGGAFDSDKAVDGMKASLEAIARLREGGVSGEEVERACEGLIAGWRDELATVEGAATAYERAVILGQSLERVREFPDRIARVDREMVRQVAEKYLAWPKLNAVFLGDDRWLPVERLGMGAPERVLER